jgi:hypothetical protein
MIPVLTETGPLVVNLTYRLRTLPFFWALSRRPGPWGLQRTGCLPEPPSWRIWLRYGVDPGLVGIEAADFAICAGTLARHHPLIGARTVMLDTCAPDVFRVEEVKPDAPYRKPYAVFLDEAIDEPHRDYATLGLTPPERWAYRFEMDALLKEFADVLNMPIITAYRERGDTPNLVFHSSYVVAHSSTAISFAVLFNKPVKIVIPACLENRPEGANARAMKAALELGYTNYTLKYLATPEAMKKKKRPEQLLEDYLHA